MCIGSTTAFFLSALKKQEPHEPAISPSTHYVNPEKRSQKSVLRTANRETRTSNLRTRVEKHVVTRRAALRMLLARVFVPPHWLLRPPRTKYSHPASPPVPPRVDLRRHKHCPPDNARGPRENRLRALSRLRQSRAPMANHDRRLPAQPAHPPRRVFAQLDEATRVGRYVKCAMRLDLVRCLTGFGNSYSFQVSHFLKAFAVGASPKLGFCTHLGPSQSDNLE